MKTKHENSKVAIIKCENYDQTEVDEAVARGLELLGGLKQFVNPEDYVLLKPNLLSGNKPEEGVTTHPAVFEAVAKKFQQYCDNVKFGDSPGRGSTEKIATEAGLVEVAERLNIDLVDFNEGQNLFYKENGHTRKFKVAHQVVKCDALINLAKLKTHSLTRITGAIKNIFGCISGLEKAEFHLKLPEVGPFSKMLVELNQLVTARLHIMDGIMGMEGNGPGAGEMRPVNVLLFSSDPVALDAVFSRIINLDPAKVFTNYYGEEMGLGNMGLENIELVGDELNDLIVKDFDVYRGADTGLRTNHPILRMKFLKNTFSRKPAIDQSKCIKCGVCIEQCPTNPKSLSRKAESEVPVYDYKRCIRCYCCQEICPEKAIYVKTPVLRKIIDFFYY
jgi:uncharacterized protein (DUF362 family)/Pyruvate/2-oxoacid:ferredoxin oxidoreductase delta subunit